MCTTYSTVDTVHKYVWPSAVSRQRPATSILPSFRLLIPSLFILSWPLPFLQYKLKVRFLQAHAWSKLTLYSIPAPLPFLLPLPTKPKPFFLKKRKKEERVGGVSPRCFFSVLFNKNADRFVIYKSGKNGGGRWEGVEWD